MVPALPVGFLLPTKGRIRPRGFHAGCEFAECIVPGDGPGPVGHYGRMCSAESSPEERNEGNEKDSHVERRWTEVFDGYYQSVCDVSGVDDDQECEAFLEVCLGCLRVADGVLHALLYRAISIDSENDMLRLLSVRSITFNNR